MMSNDPRRAAVRTAALPILACQGIMLTTLALVALLAAFLAALSAA